MIEVLTKQTLWALFNKLLAVTVDERNLLNDLSNDSWIDITQPEQKNHAKYGKAQFCFLFLLSQSIPRTSTYPPQLVVQDSLN